MPKNNPGSKELWTLSDSIDPLASPLARLSPSTPIVFALLIICLPFLDPPPDSVWTVQYWAGTDANRMAMIRNFALIIGGGLGIWLAWRRIVVSEKQTEIAMQEHNARRFESLEQRYENAITLLHQTDRIARAAGIAALEGLALKHPDHFFSRCTNLVCTYLRLRSPVRGERTLSQDDVKSLLDTIQRLVLADAVLSLNAAFDLSGVAFAGQKFSGWDFKNVDLRNSEFSDVIFSGCHIEGDIRSAAYFEDCQFRSSTFVAHFVRVDFSDCEFHECDFDHKIFDECTLKEAILHECWPTNAAVNSELPDRWVLRECNISSLTISGESEDRKFRPANFHRCFVENPSVIPVEHPGQKDASTFHASEFRHPFHPERVYVEMNMGT